MKGSGVNGAWLWWEGSDHRRTKSESGKRPEREKSDRHRKGQTVFARVQLLKVWYMWRTGLWPLQKRHGEPEVPRLQLHSEHGLGGMGVHTAQLIWLGLATRLQWEEGNGKEGIETKAALCRQWQ